MHHFLHQYIINTIHQTLDKIKREKECRREIEKERRMEDEKLSLGFIQGSRKQKYKERMG